MAVVYKQESHHKTVITGPDGAAMTVVKQNYADVDIHDREP
jgi:hypothetical protein